MGDKNFMAVVGILIVGVIGAAVFLGGDSNTGTTDFIGDPKQVATGEPSADGSEVQKIDHILGPEDAQVTLIEYGDFECPACLAFYPELKDLEAAYPDDVRVVFRHYPLTSIHPNAFAAHRASEAAANQGKFWEMHDLLYERQTSWRRSSTGFDTSQAAEVFEQFASELGLDVEQFKADVESQAVSDHISTHQDAGQQLDVTGTPTVFINGELIQERTFEQLSLIVEEILLENGGSDEQTDTTTEAEDTETTDTDETQE